MSLRAPLYESAWTGELGDAITRTTLVWYPFDPTGSPVSLGWLSFCLTAPVVVCGMTAGLATPVLGVRVAVAVIALITCAIAGAGLSIAELRRAR